MVGWRAWPVGFRFAVCGCGRLGCVPSKVVLPEGGTGFPQQFPLDGPYGAVLGHVLSNGEDDLVDDDPLLRFGERSHELCGWVRHPVCV